MSHDVTEIVKRRKMTMYANMTKTSRRDAMENMSYSEIFVMRRTYEFLIDTYVISGIFTSGPKENWEVSFETIDGKTLGIDSVRTNEHGYITSELDLPDELKIYKIEARCVDASGKDSLNGQFSIIGENISTILKNTDKSFYACQISTIFTDGIKDDSTLILNQDSIGSYAYFDQLKYVYQSKLDIYDLNTNPYDITTLPFIAVNTSQLSLSLTALVYGLQYLFPDYLEAYIRKDIYNHIISSGSTNIEIFNQNFVEGLISDITNNIVSTGGTIKDPNTDLQYATSTILTGTNDNAGPGLLAYHAGILECIYSISTYNNYDLHSNVGQSVVDMHIALDSIKKQLDTSGINLTKDANDLYVIPHSIDTATFQQDIDNQFNTLSNETYTYTPYASEDRRVIRLSGTFCNGPKLNWKVTIFNTSGQTVQTDIYTKADGTIDEVSLALNKDTRIIKVTAECVDNSGKDSLTGKTSRIGDKISTLVEIKADINSYTFYASQISTLFASSLKNLTMAELNNFSDLKSDFLKSLGFDDLIAQGIDVMDTNPYDVTLNPYIANKISIVNAELIGVLSGLTELLDSESLLTDKTYLDIQVNDGLYGIIKARIDQDNFANINLTDTAFIDDIISFVGTINNVSIVNTANDYSDNVKKIVEFIRSYNNYDTTGGDVQASIVSIHKALQAFENTLASTQIDWNNISDVLDSKKVEVDNESAADANLYNFPEFVPILDSTQTITISGIFSGGPKVNWQVVFSYLSGGIIDVLDVNGNPLSLTTDSNGSVTNITFNLPTSTQIYKVTAKAPTSGGSDKLTGNDSIEGESISTIVTTNDTFFYASQISSLFVTSLKNELTLDLTTYETLKQAFEEKLGIYDPNGDGFNSNPYDVSLNPAFANEISLLNLSLSTLISGLSTVFDSSNVDNSEILNGIYEQISTFTAGSPVTISMLSDKDIFINPIVTDIGNGNNYVDTAAVDAVKLETEALAKGVSFINEYNTYLSTGGDISGSLLNMHSAFESVKTVLSTPATDLTDLGAFESGIVANIPSVSSYTFPYYEPTVESSSFIPVNIVIGFFSGGPKVNWKVTFSYLSGFEVSNVIFSGDNGQFTDTNGSISATFNLLPSTEIYKVTATSTTSGYDALTGVPILSTTETHSISTILTPELTTFYASQISNLFVTSIKSETDLDLARYQQLKQAFEQKLGIYDPNGDGINTNPYEITVSPAFANTISVLNLSLTALVLGLDASFDGSAISVSTPMLLSSIYEEIMSSADATINLSLLTTPTFIDNIIDNVVDNTGNLSGVEANNIKNAMKLNSNGISACVTSIQSNDIFSSTGGDVSSSIINIHATLTSIINILDSPNLNLESTTITSDIKTEKDTINTTQYSLPYYLPQTDPNNLIPINISIGYFAGGPKVNWKVTFTYLSGGPIPINDPSGSGSTLDYIVTSLDGSIQNVELNILPNTELYKVSAIASFTLGSRDALTNELSTSGDSLSTLIKVIEYDPNDPVATSTTFFASQISNLFVTILKDITNLSGTEYDTLLADFEQTLGIDNQNQGGVWYKYQPI